jgi:hypothetical protein
VVFIATTENKENESNQEGTTTSSVDQEEPMEE